MNIIVPEYYKRFKCIADKCKHNCCIGWEIDIDDKTLDLYKAHHDEICKKIDFNSSEPHFILDDKEKCPFLNKNNLCELILNYGEDFLCQICSDHPRFRNFIGTREELGLGLCCEAACKLILSQTSKVTLENADKTTINSDEDIQDFLEFRQHIFSVIQNREKRIENRIFDLICKYNLDIPEFNYIIDFLLSLEILDNSWKDILNKIKTSDINLLEPLDDKWDTVFEQLIVYFIYRHFADAIYDDSIKERLRFSIIGYVIIKSLCLLHLTDNRELSTDIIAEYSRMFSAEIEYSEENMNAVMFNL